MLRHLIKCLVGSTLIFLCACQDYDYKVNDKVVYTPKQPFRNFTTPDPGLTTCLEQAIIDGKVTTVQQLTTLDCSFAGIENLEGLATFTNLKALRLSSNKVRNLVELNKIITLETVYLDNNQIIDPVPLYQLPALRYLDLSGNTAMQCPKPGSLTQVTTLIMPEHCS